MSLHYKIMKPVFLFLFLLFFSMLYGQSDSINLNGTSSDSLSLIIASPDASPGEEYFDVVTNILSSNTLLNSKGSPSAIFVTERKSENKNFLFYGICVTVLFFALLKTFYSRYFFNIFRVFFNTSLRQSQLTDQLVQAKLPSLFFNIFFVLTGGFYIFLLLSHLGHIKDVNNINVFLLCMAALSVIYVAKYIILKFTGWISGYRSEADTYIFIIFLINKIIAIAFIPVIIVMAFSDAYLVSFVVLLSYLMIMLMLVSRFFRSYSILQNKIQVQRLHFFLYIFGIEILPLLIIYKYALNLLTIYL